MFELTDRVILVTGAGGNLGAATARTLLREQARLVLVERNLDKLHTLFPELDDQPERLLALSADLTDAASVAGMVRAALDHFGQLDAAANTVGGYRAGAPVHETSLDTWDFMLNLNARTAFLLSQAVVPPLLERGGGKIVHVAARSGLAGAAKIAAYSIAKSAVIRLTESLAAELRLKNINVNCVLPGRIDTPENRAEMPDADFSRWVPPEEIASVIVFLLSDAARAINGAAIPVYGKS